jgi:hypothetical protein
LLSFIAFPQGVKRWILQVFEAANAVMNKFSRNIICFVSLSLCCLVSGAQYKAGLHRKPAAAEKPVYGPGNYAEPGATYVLMNDISSDRSAVFLGKDVTLDLNGYTIKYAQGNYQHVLNPGFEEGSRGWDMSKAPRAKIMNTADVHVFLGKKLLSLEAGDEIRSSFVHLPVAGRSYMAMCGITGRYYNDPKMKGDLRNEMKVSVYVEDSAGNNITCLVKYGDTTMAGAPVEGKSPRLGGGFVYAHLTNLPAGKYRIRIKAITDCLVDEIDIRPAMDVGVSIIGNTIPLAHYDHLIRQSYPPILPAFFDYTQDVENGLPLAGLPRVTGAGNIVIKNGTIESLSDGVLSWGVQSTMQHVKVVLRNVHVKTSGISSGAANLMWTDIDTCRFDVDMPFLIQRHVGLCAVVLRGKQASEISRSAFYGGQGCLSIQGKNSLIHDNLFVNRQTVTNHYSIMGTGDSSKIYNNRFEPEQGSGIYVSRHTEVFNNIFKIKSSAPTCEFGREEYSVAAIRLGDYNAPPGSPKASVGNKTYGNKIYVTAENYSYPKEYIPMAWGIYYSASGGDNYVYENEFYINNKAPESKSLAAALYICGGPKYFGGQFYSNKIKTNVPAAWVASMYGGASNSAIYNNAITQVGNNKFSTIRMGWEPCKDCVAKNIVFRSNEVSGADFSIDKTGQQHSYTVAWTYSLKAIDVGGRPVKNCVFTIKDKDGVVVSNTTNELGEASVELTAFKLTEEVTKENNPYSISIGEVTKQFWLTKNISQTIKLNR